MKKLFFILFLFVCTTIEAQLNHVTDFRTYSGDAAYIFVTDTLQGGFFTRYTGADEPDGGMVFMDGKARKWLRYTEDAKIKIRWYGLKPYNNYGTTDDAIVVRKAIKYIKNHRNRFDVLKMDLCRFNEWYYIGSTVYLEGISLEGEGQKKRPKTLFQVAAGVTAFRIPAGDGYVSVKDVATRHYANAENKTDSTHHSFDIHTVVSFDNVSVLENPNGDGFHLDACAYANPKDSVHFGNADQSRFNDCFADMSINGFWINGCDANVISFTDCSASSNARWGIYDNGLLGNKYYNLHLANNGKRINTGATLNNDTATYFLRADFGEASLGKRPDQHPEIWYKNSTGLGGPKEWDPKRKYFSGGGVWAANANANHLFIGTYTESFSPSNIISPRSNWIEGLNGADVIGGMYEHTYGGYKFFSGNGIQSPVVATPTLRLQATNGTAEVDISTDATSSLRFKLPAKSGTLALEGENTTSNNGFWIFPIGDQNTIMTTGANKFSFRLPFGCTIIDVRFSTVTPSTSGMLLFDINTNGASILSRKVGIDVGEKTSISAVQKTEVINKSLADDSEITVDVNAAGSGVKGVKMIIYYKKN